MISTTRRACSRFIRYAKAAKRDFRRQAEYDEVELLTLENRTINPSEQAAIENELLGAIESEVVKLNEICQALWEVAKEDKESLFNSAQPLLVNRGNSSTLTRIMRLRVTVSKALDDYRNDYRTT